MKALCTDLTYKGTDELRQSAGGYGFHIASGLVTGWSDHCVMPTYEGVNVILYQQSARYCFKMMKKLKKGKKLTRNFSYINNLKELLNSKSTAKRIEDVLDLDYIEQVLQTRSCYHLESTYEAMESSKASSSAKTNDLFAPQVEKMSKYHIGYIMF